MTKPQKFKFYKNSVAAKWPEGSTVLIVWSDDGIKPDWNNSNICGYHRPDWCDKNHTWYERITERQLFCLIELP